MGYLTIISETGFPHSACLFEYNVKAEWYGFKPKVPKAPRGAGYVDDTDRSSYIKNSVRFAIADTKLAQVIAQLLSTYEGLTYCVGKKDCVNFSVDAAQWCGLKTPKAPNLFPDNLVKNLAQLNANLVQ